MSIQIILLVTALLVAGLVIVGQVRKAALRSSNPPVGRLIDVGGYRLHLAESGEGPPVVVLESGQGDCSLGWSLVQPEVAKFARVVAYDRSGLGWSEQGPNAHTVGAAVNDLHTLLDNVGIEGPVVLVGASWGGMAARLYAHRYPQQVAGIVLVDSSHEEQFAPEPIQKTMQQMRRMMPIMYGVLGLIVRSGLAALRPAMLPDSLGISRLPPEAAQRYRAILGSSAKHVSASAGELCDLPASQAEMRNAQITSLGDIPLIVLVHGKAQPMMASPEVSQLLEDTHRRLSAEVAALSTRGKVVVAENAGHAIQIDDPALIIASIREVVDSVRS